MRLIDADALPRHKQLEAFGNGQYEDIDIVYGNDIDKAPTIDAVPKTQCRDCQFSGRYSGIDLRRINATD